MPLDLQLLQDALSTCITAIAPVILVLLLISVATAIFQSALQIEDVTFSLMLKIFATILLLLVGGAFLLDQFETLAALWLTHAPALLQKSWT